MEEALRTFLEQLEAIEENCDCEGFGDTICRDFMGDEILRGFLRLEPNFVPTGEYDLDPPKANKRVGKAIEKFVRTARKAAEREGLTTFHQRLAAFQNLEVRTAGGADYNDFFGYKDGSDFDADGNELL